MATEKRLIDANALMAVYRKVDYNSPGAWSLRDILNFLEIAPTVDAKPVVHGRWEWYADRCEDLFLGCDDDYGWRCSMCEVPLDDEDDPEVMPTFRYCPNCGAKMDGDGNEST